MSGRLRRLDDRLVPKLARATRRVATTAARTHRVAVSAIPRRRAEPTAPSGPAAAVLRLRRLDDRWARRGPLAVLRELPQVGAFVLAVLVLVSGATVLQRSEPRSDLVAETPVDTPPDAPGADTGETALVGPDIGDDVRDYVDDADRRLRDRFVDDPAERSFAVISFDRYLTPDEVAKILTDVGAFRVFFKVSAPGLQTEIQETPVKRLVPDLLAAYRRVATQRRADVAPLLEMARTTDDPEFKSFYEATAKAYETEIRQLSGPCACVFGAVTVAGNDMLRTLRGRLDVRVVDLGPRGVTFDGLTFRALLPEERVTVTGGNEAPPSPGG